MLEPLTQSSAIIQIHAYAAIAAFGLGGLVLFSRKGSARHKMSGRIWVALMAVTALSSFFISTIGHIGPFSAIHALSVFTLIALVSAIRDARRGHIASHRATMKSLYVFALIVAGIFTFWPGRIMHETLIAPVMAQIAM